MSQNICWKPDQKSFFWAGGIEDTFIPQSRPGLRPLEEYELTQHYTQWREDLQRAASLGITALRWGVPWYRVEAQPGKFDWSWTDEVLTYMVNELHIQPIIDLMHYGTPLWLTDSFVDSEYPERVAEYTAEFTQRYKDLVHFYTPLNEPTVNAEYSGLRGVWPPYLTGEQGNIRVLLSIARGIQLSAQAIRRYNPNAVLVAVEAMNWTHALTPEAQAAATHLEQRNFLCWDLVSGLVNEDHPLYGWLLENGATEARLSELRERPIMHDILGVNFYPWSALQLSIDATGAVQKEVVPSNGHLLADVLRRCYAHTHLPMIVTETSASGTHEERMRWMDETLDAVRTICTENMPVIGYTWFPIFSMVEWEYRETTKPVNEHLLHLGLWDLAHNEKGMLVRHETSLVKAYREYIFKHTSEFSRG